MTMSIASLKQAIIDEFVALGAKTESTHSWVDQLAEAIATAVYTEITTNARDSLDGSIT